jgi:two-component SAPR family response regulator
MKLRVVALDDENHALERFAAVAKEFDEIASCRLFSDEEELLAQLDRGSVDVVFLDIEMPGKTGMQLVDEIHAIDPAVSLVFVTAYSQYAVEAFEQNAVDYLIKPVSGERLRKTLDRLRGSARNQERPAQNVKIRCFLRFEIRIDGSVPQQKMPIKGRELLAFLVARSGAETSWDQITEALWPDVDYEKAHNNLHATTYRLRRWLSENGVSGIFEARRNSYRVIPSEYGCDMADLEEALRAAEWKKAELLYRGEFLEEEGYEWAYPIQAEWSSKVRVR